MQGISVLQRAILTVCSTPSRTKVALVSNDYNGTFTVQLQTHLSSAFVCGVSHKVAAARMYAVR
jgi:hypothetical protein